MGIQFISQYLIAFAGLAVGAGLGLLATTMVKPRAASLRPPDAHFTIPLLLAVGLAHASLIPVVELERQVLFGLYFLSVIGVIGVAMLGMRIWRLGAVLLPVGSILGYFYFAFAGHQADVVGLIVKVVEVGLIIAAVTSVLGVLPLARERDIAA